MISKFRHAFAGLRASFQDPSLRLQYLLALITILFFSVLHISVSQWILILACITEVIVLEMINTCIERVCDLYSLKKDRRIQFIKDLSAAMVLVGSFAALCIGLYIVAQTIGGK